MLKTLICLLCSLVVLSGCKIDTSSQRQALIDAMNAQERMFYYSKKDLIESNIDLEHLARDASRLGYTNILKYLVALGVDLSKSDGEGFTSFLLAAQLGDLTTVRYLVEETNIDVFGKTQDGFTALMFACKAKNIALIQYLLDRGANAKAKTKFGQTALMFACSTNDFDLVKYLLSQKNLINLNAQDDAGHSALFYTDSKQIKDFLLAQGLQQSP